jgi:predicted nucleic acid-binding protein
LILDTNALSAWADEDEALEQKLPAAHLLALPVIVIGEYRYGVQRSRDRTRFETWLEQVIRTTRVLEVTLATTKSYADVRLMLHRKGKPIPASDAWISALAIQHRLPVISRDGHFDDVDGLTRISW